MKSYEWQGRNGFQVNFQVIFHQTSLSTNPFVIYDYDNNQIKYLHLF